MIDTAADEEGPQSAAAAAPMQYDYLSQVRTEADAAVVAACESVAKGMTVRDVGVDSGGHHGSRLSASLDLQDARAALCRPAVRFHD